MKEWGGYGPTGLTVDADGNLFAADYDHHRVVKFTSDGVSLTEWGSSGSGSGQFTYPHSVAVSRSGTVYVTDQQNHRIQVFAPTTAPSATQMTTAPNPSNCAQQVAAVVAVIPPDATGQVDVLDGGIVIASAALFGGEASVPLTGLVVGMHSLTAAYRGNGAYAASYSPAVVQVVDPVPTTTAVTSDVNPSMFGETVTFTATLSPSDAAGVVAFFADSATSPFDSATVVVGAATVTLASLPTGFSVIVARYRGDGCHSPSASEPYDQVVSLLPSTTTLTSAPNPSVLGGRVTLAATVSPPFAAGTVTFSADSIPLGTAPLAGGTATISDSSLAIGSHSLTAIYTGDENVLGSASPAVVQTITSPNPVILAVRDVPNDLGRQIRITWTRAFHDTATASNPVTRYSIWRRVDAALMTRTTAQAESQGSTMRTLAYPPGTWDYVTDVPARGEATYGTVVPTLCDSTFAGMCWSVFFVSGVTASPFIYFDSAPDSGYSKDNVPPTTPLTSTPVYNDGTFTLAWETAREPDFYVYRLYRGMTADFLPDPSNLVVAKTDPGYVCAAPAASYFKLCAVDLANNESPLVVMTLAHLLSAGSPEKLRFALSAARPNPARTGRLIVEFVLAETGPARLALLDIAGRRVAEREVGTLGIGRHEVDLALGTHLTPGLYVVRLTQGAIALTRTACVLE